MVTVLVCIGIALLLFYLQKRRNNNQTKKQEEVMPQGLQVFDENGNLKIDITNRLCKVLGTLDTGFTAGSITDSNVQVGDIWIFPYRAEMPSNYDPGGDAVSGVLYAVQRPVFQKTSTGISWTFPASAAKYNQRMYCYYGVY